MINLVRPIIFFDLEATGTDRENDRIVEISVLKLELDGSTKTFTTRINPTIPIPAGATEIHHITDNDVKDCKTFAQLAPGLFQSFKGCDLAGFNSNNYDVPLLYNEFLRCGLVLDYKSVNLIDVGNIFKIQEQRTLTAAAKFYCGVDLEDAHSAEADIKATYEVFKAQLEKYPDLPQDVAELAKFTNYGKNILDLSGKFCEDDNGVVLYNFGKNRGKPVKEDLGFLNWMMGKDFAPDTLEIAQKLYNEFAFS